jgi:hypothetical protein
VEQQPYATDMSPCDYDFFAKITEPLRGTRYDTREIIYSVGRLLLDINRNGHAYDVLTPSTNLAEGVTYG